MDVNKTRHAILYNCCPDPYINLKFQMTLKRNSALYSSILVMPAAGTHIIYLFKNKNK